jgi:hypothetical protein
LTSVVEVAKEDKAVEWLLDSKNPAIRYWTLKDILDEPDGDDEVVQTREQIASWTPVAQCLREQHSEGYWGSGEDVYWPKWTATVWPLILLGEIGVPGSHPSIRKGCEYFLKVMDGQDRSWPPPKYPDEDLRGWRLIWEPCVTGNMARTLAAFDYGDDPRVREMFEWLVKYQREDGGWNCDTEDSRNGEAVHHSSFMSTIEPLWAFSTLDPQKWPRGGREAVERAAEFMLIHQLYKSDKTGKVIRNEWTQLHFPMFYFYDILHGLRVLSKLGYGGDERMIDARELLLSKRLANGTWPLEALFVRALRMNFVKDPANGYWGKVMDEKLDRADVYTKGGSLAETPAIYSSLGEVGRANPWVTLNALRALKHME